MNASKGPNVYSECHTLNQQSSGCSKLTCMHRWRRGIIKTPELNIIIKCFLHHQSCCHRNVQQWHHISHVCLIFCSLCFRSVIKYVDFGLFSLSQYGPLGKPLVKITKTMFGLIVDVHLWQGLLFELFTCKIDQYQHHRCVNGWIWNIVSTQSWKYHLKKIYIYIYIVLYLCFKSFYLK